MTNKDLRDDLQSLYEKYRHGPTEEQIVVAGILAAITGLTFDKPRLMELLVRVSDIVGKAMAEGDKRFN